MTTALIVRSTIVSYCVVFGTFVVTVVVGGRIEFSDEGNLRGEGEN